MTTSLAIHLTRTMKLLSTLAPLCIPIAAKRTLGNQNRTGYAPALTAVDVQNGVCAPLTIIYARGTNEPGNIGSVIGPRMFWSFGNALNGNIALQGVNYPADNFGNVVHGATGAPSMTELALKAKDQCPDTKLALIGYSQGASVTHYTLNNGTLPSSLVDAIVVFGDPEHPTNGSFGSVPQSLVKDYCQPDDLVCNTGAGPVTDGHKAYMISDAVDAVQFVLNVTGLTTEVLQER